MFILLDLSICYGLYPKQPTTMFFLYKTEILFEKLVYDIYVGILKVIVRLSFWLTWYVKALKKKYLLNYILCSCINYSKLEFASVITCIDDSFYSKIFEILNIYLFIPKF